MKKLLLVAPIFPPEIGGPATYTYDIAQRFKKGRKVRIIAFADKFHKIKKVKITALRIAYCWFGSIRRQWNLFRSVIRDARWADVVYIQGPVVVGFTSVIVCKLLGKPHALKFVGDIAWETAFGSGKTKKFLDTFLEKPDAGIKNRMLIGIQKWVFNNAQRVIVPSQYLKHILVKYYDVPEKNVEVIYNSVDFSIYKNISQKKNKKKTIITVGRLVKWKNIAGIIRAIAKVDEDIVFQIVGDGPETDALKELAASLGIEEKVVFIGRVPHKKVLRMLAKAHIFILNSYYEGLPHTVIEALMCNCPTIATKIKGTNEIAVHNKTALTVGVNKDDAIAAAIERICREKKLAERLTQTGKKLVYERFNWTTNFAELERVLSALAK